MYIKLLKEVKEELVSSGRKPHDAKIIAVSKGFDVEAILKVYHQGCRDFAESRLQELLVKKIHLPLDINWHFIGPLQKNKVAKIIVQCSLIHSVDSLELAQKISEIAQSDVSILLEVNTSQEPSKHGFYEEELEAMISQIFNLKNLNIKGLMTIGPLHGDPRPSFQQLRRLKEKHQLQELSMGMSRDFRIAVQEGATLLRIGRSLFI